MTQSLSTHRIGSTSATEVRYPVSLHRLSNGMELLLLEDHRIPNVALYIYWKVGSRNERPGCTGLSHFIEHMMFNGAAKYGAGEFDHILEAAGGSNNAYTSKNITVYQDWFPSTALEKVFDLEADRMGGLRFDPEVVESERGVVASERRTTVESNPLSALSEKLWEVAFTVHPYRWPVIGWMEDIESWTLEDLQAFFDIHYSPQNATLVIVGDIQPSAVLELAETYFGSLPVRGVPQPVRLREPAQKAERRDEVRRPAQLSAFAVGYHVPPANHADFYALQVVETLLLEGQSSRLFRRLVDREGAALWVRGGTDFSFDPSLFILTVQMRQGVDPSVGQKLLDEELDRLRQEPVTEQELRKAKNMLELELYRSLKSIDGRADVLGSYHLFFGDHRAIYQAIDAYESLTPERLRDVVGRIFAPDRRTLVTLIPEGKDNGDGGASQG